MEETLNTAPNVAEDAQNTPVAEAPAAPPAVPAGRESTLARLSAQLNEAAALYPGLNLGAEMKNPQFCALLRGGADVLSAYEFIHREEHFKGMVAQIAGNVRTRVLRDVAARGARPAENGTAGRAPATLREPRPSEWSREERDRIGREALRGIRHRINL